MSWATGYIERLRKGEMVSFRPRGHSMEGRISSGNLCTVEPIPDHSKLEVGDVVLCKVKGSQYLHLIRAISKSHFQIGNNRGHINGWTSAAQIFGKLVKVEE